jgi:isopenicillin N synthase-like dioxygenase
LIGAGVQSCRLQLTTLCCLRRKHSASAMGHVPVIDLSGPQGEVAKAVQSACSTSGFFLISNHGVSEDTIARSFEENKKFFALPEEQKTKIKVNEMNRHVMA